MNVIDIKFKNFRSYGNNFQYIKLGSNELVAIKGVSGSGKTVIKEVFEYCVFGKARSRRNSDKNSKMRTLPNRRNKDLKTEINIKVNNKILNIKRGMNPSLFKVYYNNIEIEDNKQYNIEKILGIDSNIYNSFISFSQSEVLNFTNLSKQQKNNIINQLFNYEYILTLSKKIDDLIKHNSIEKDKKIVELNVLEKQCKKDKLKLNSLDKKFEDKDKKEDIDNNSLKYKKLKSELDDILDLEKKLKDDNNEVLKSYYSYTSKLDDIKSKLDIYKNDKCPYCLSDLKNKLDLDLDSEYNNVKNNIENINESLKNFSDKINENNLNKNKINNEINDILVDTKLIKKNIELKNAISRLNENELVENIKEYDLNINSLKKDINKNLAKHKAYVNLNNLISEEGEFKKQVLNKILPNINELIKKLISKIDFEYTISIDNDLSVKVKQYNNEIDIDEPSNGEIKRINLIIMFSFVLNSVFKNKINFMFLDEILEGLDLKSTYDIIDALKSILSEDNVDINVFMICHKLNDYSKFDKIIEVKKNFFSDIFIKTP